MNNYAIWLSTSEIGKAQLDSFTETAPKSPLLCVHRSRIRYGFRAGAKAIRCGVNTHPHHAENCHRSYVSTEAPFRQMKNEKEKSKVKNLAKTRKITFSTKPQPSKSATPKTCFVLWGNNVYLFRFLLRHQLEALVNWSLVEFLHCLGGRGYLSREAIILNIFIKGGDYSREAINRGTAIIRENTVPFSDKQYPFGLEP